MMGTKARSFAPLCNRSIEDLVPADNVYRHLETKLDLSFPDPRLCEGDRQAEGLG